MTSDLETLTSAEATKLVEREQVIERGLATFVDVGTALAEIRDERLYRCDHDTFEDYCRDRWGISRPRAYELMNAASAVSAMADTGLPAPGNERQARELARVPAEQRAEVWQQTIERTDGKPTAAAIRESYQPRPADLERPCDVSGHGFGPHTACPETVPAPDPLPAEIAEQVERRVEAKQSVADALDRYVPDPDEPVRRWRLAFLDALRPAFKVPAQFSVEQAAEQIDDECLDELRRAAEQLSSYYERVKVARPVPDNVRHLRAV